MPRFKIVIQYDGTQYCGWQTQKNGLAIQPVLEKILGSFSGNNSIKITGAGRTDSGVHALGQVAHFDLKTDLDTCTLKRAINAKCPEDINIVSCNVVSPDFHARFSAVRRTYRYQCYTGTNPLYKNQSWFLPRLNIDTLNSISKNLLGTHDFLSFSKWNKKMKNTECDIFQSVWTKENNMVIFTVIGNRYLHHMVRYLTGTMVAVAQNKYSENYFFQLLSDPQKDVTLHKAPAKGLFLEKVEYVQ
jgi:tRNA pseudouridine38-40 synthase